MKIARSEQRWRLLEEEHVMHDCLECLAFQQGYRVLNVCAELGIGEQHFRKVFQRDVGIPIKEWMRRERMVVARRMLAWGVNYTEVSNLLGFAHPNSFRREFSEVYGVTAYEFLKIRRMRNEQMEAFLQRSSPDEEPRLHS